MHSNGSSMNSRGTSWARSNVNTSFTSSTPRGRTFNAREGLGDSDQDLIAKQEQKIEDYQHKLAEMFRLKCDVEAILTQRNKELEKAQHELCKLRTLLDTSQVDERRGALAVKNLPKKVAADLITIMENDGRAEELEIKCKKLEKKNEELEARLKKSEEGCAMQVKLLRSSTAERDLEKSKAEKFQGDLLKLKNTIDTLLSNAKCMQVEGVDHEANPFDAAPSPTPSSASAMVRSVGQNSQRIESDLEEELEEEELEEPASQSTYMAGVSFSKFDDMGIDLDSD